MKWKALDQIFIIIFKSQCELNLKTEETVIFGFPKIRVCVLPEYLTQTLSNAFLSINSDQRYEFTRASLFICSLQTCTTAVPCMHPGPGKGSRRQQPPAALAAGNVAKQCHLMAKHTLHFQCTTLFCLFSFSAPKSFTCCCSGLLFCTTHTEGKKKKKDIFLPWQRWHIYISNKNNHYLIFSSALCVTWSKHVHNATLSFSRHNMHGRPEPKLKPQWRMATSPLLAAMGQCLWHKRQSCCHSVDLPLPSSQARSNTSVAGCCCMKTSRNVNANTATSYSQLSNEGVTTARHCQERCKTSSAANCWTARFQGGFLLTSHNQK